MAGLTFDSAVLIGLERGDEAAYAWLTRAVERGAVPCVSTLAVAETWRDGARQARLSRALKAMAIEPVDEELARRAGAALAAVASASTVDAVIAASAARSGSVLVTGDPVDMRQLALGHFRTLRVAELAGELEGTE